MRLLAATIAVPVALLGWQWWGDHSLEGKLSPIASGVAGREVHVNCQGFWPSLIDIGTREGEVRFDARGLPEAKLFITHGKLACLTAVDWSAPDPLP